MPLNKEKIFLLEPIIDVPNLFAMGNFFVGVQLVLNSSSFPWTSCWPPYYLSIAGRIHGACISFCSCALALTHFGQPCCLVHDASQVYLGFCGSRSRPPDMSTEEARHLYCVAKTDSPWTSGGCPPRLLPAPAGLGLLPGTWSTSF